MNEKMMSGARAAVLLCSAALLAASAMAQDSSAPPPPPQGQMQGPPPGGPRGGRGGDPEQRLERMQKFLNLSDDQTAKIRGIMAEERGKMEALRSADSAPQDRRGQMMAIHQDGDVKIHAVLTADQRTKYDAMEAKMRERMQERGGRGQGGPGRSGGNGGDTPPTPPPPPTPPQD